MAKNSDLSRLLNFNPGRNFHRFIALKEQDTSTLDRVYLNSSIGLRPYSLIVKDYSLDLLPLNRLVGGYLYYSMERFIIFLESHEYKCDSDLEKFYLKKELKAYFNRLLLPLIHKCKAFPSDVQILTEEEEIPLSQTTYQAIA
jgi:hypothetical protein